MSVILGTIVFTLSYYVVGLPHEISFVTGMSTTAAVVVQKRAEKRENRVIAKMAKGKKKDDPE